jgi:tRNA wybutosine-synthesizing protein 4
MSLHMNIQDVDAGVKRTNGDAQTSKMSCVMKGYFEDSFVEHFVSRSDMMMIRSLPPVINRGYYARHVILKSLLLHFLGSFDDSAGGPQSSPDRQVVVLGCGFDTLYFQLLKNGELSTNVKYVECDFPDVVKRKRSIADRFGLDLHCYSLVGADLRNAHNLMSQLDEVGVQRDLPTFFLAECVLVYMDLEFSNSLLQCLSSGFSRAMCAIYEQVNSKDAFGRQMMVNLRARGCPLRGVLDSLVDQRQRMLDCGWSQAHSENLLTLFNSCIPIDDVLRINKLEMLDEEEEWKLLLEHYCITTARNFDVPIFKGCL